MLFSRMPKNHDHGYKQFAYVYMPHRKLIIESLCKDSTCTNMFSICSLPKIAIQTSACKLFTSGPANIDYASSAQPVEPFGEPPFSTDA